MRSSLIFALAFSITVEHLFGLVYLMPTSDSYPTETSPLLGADGDGVAPKAVIDSTANGTLPDGSAEIGSGLERHDSIDESRAAQFQGRPDIQQQLKYIIPAVSIGVI
jgi:hypothetical protein